MSWHHPEPATPNGQAFQQHPGGPTYYLDHEGRLNRMKVELEFPEANHQYEESEPMDLDITPPFLNTRRPVRGIDPEHLLPRYRLNVDPERYLEAIQEKLPRNVPGLTLGVSHVFFKFRAAIDGSSWHCERCHAEKGYEDAFFEAKTIHNVQPGGIPEALWDSRCPLPDCGRRVAHRKDVVECARCSETLVMNQRYVNTLQLTVNAEPETNAVPTFHEPEPNGTDLEYWVPALLPNYPQQP